MHAQALSSGLCFNVGGAPAYAPSREVQDDTTSLARNLLGSYTATVPCTSLPVTVSWTFNGVYSDKQIGDVTASITLPLG